MWRECTEALQRSTVHGIAHASAARTRAGRSFWLTLLLLGVGAFIFNLAQVVTRYHSKPILTSYFTDYENMTWPDITFCNNVPIKLINSTLYERWQLYLNEAEIVHHYLSNISQLEYLKMFTVNGTNLMEQVTKPTLALSSLKPHEFDFGNPKLFIEQGGYLQDRVSIQRSIEDGGAWDEYAPNANPYRPFLFFNRHRMPCFTFQLDRISDFQLRNRITSLFFFVVYDFESYKRFASDFIGYGGRIYITLPDHLPSIDAYIQSQPGFQRVITLKQTRDQFNQEKRECREEKFYEHIYDSFLEHTHKYEISAENCKTLLSQKVIYWNCGCFSPFLPVLKLDHKIPRLCFNMSYFSTVQIGKNAECLDKIYSKYSKDNEFEKLVNKNCEAHLRRQCSKTTYRIDTSAEILSEQWSMDINAPRMAFQRGVVDGLLTIKYPNNANYSVNNMTDEEVLRFLRRESNIVLIKTHNLFGDLVLEEEEYPLSQLFSDLGGLMGLYLGISVVGMFEILEIGYILTWSYRKRLQQSKDALHKQESIHNSHVYQPVSSFHATTNPLQRDTGGLETSTESYTPWLMQNQQNERQYIKANALVDSNHMHDINVRPLMPAQTEGTANWPPPTRLPLLRSTLC